MIKQDFGNKKENLLPLYEKNSAKSINQSVAYRTWEQEVAGLIPGLGQHEVAGLIPRLDQFPFWGLMIVIATGLIPLLCAVHCFDDGYVAKQPVAWIEYSSEYW